MREFLTRLREDAFLEIKEGYVDSGAAPGKDTRWKDVAQLKPQTTTKEEVAARRKRKQILWVIPMPAPRRKPSHKADARRSRRRPLPPPEPRQAGRQAGRRRRPTKNEISLCERARSRTRSITTSFLVQSKEIRQKKSGELYLSLMLGDRTGELDAKMWDNVAEVLDAFERDDFVKVKGMIQVFHNRPQMTIHKLRRMDDSEIDFADYFPVSKRDPDEMWRELRGIVAGIGNRHLKGLLEAMLDDEEIARRYRRAPAAKQIHHAFLGGLIEHVLTLCALAQADRGALRQHRSRPAADRRGPARYRQDLRAELRARLLLFERRPVDRAHLHRDADGGRQAARPARFSAAAALAGGAHDPEPSRASWNSARPRCRSFPRRCCCTTWTIWIPRWSACARRSKTTARWRAASPATARRWSARR